MWLKKGNKLYNLDKISNIEVVTGRLWIDGNAIAENVDKDILVHLTIAMKNESKVFVIE